LVLTVVGTVSSAAVPLKGNLIGRWGPLVLAGAASALFFARPLVILSSELLYACFLSMAIVSFRRYRVVALGAAVIAAEGLIRLMVALFWSGSAVAWEIFSVPIVWGGAFALIGWGHQK